MTTRRGFRYDFGSSRMEVLVDGTIAGRFNNVSPHLSLSSALEVGSGGTGLATLDDHFVLLGSGTGAITPVTPGTSGLVLTSNGTGADPSFQAASTTSAGFTMAIS